MSNSDKKVAQKRKEIDELNSKTPAPLEENIARINSDVKQLQDKLTDLQPRFGAPYKEGLDAFAKELEIKPAELYKKWAAIYKKGLRENESENLILQKFIREFKDQDKFTKAQEAFRKVISKDSMEEINEGNLNSCLMEALGLPRQIDAISCKQYIKDMQTNVCAYLEEKNGDNDISVVFASPEVKKLSFEKYEDAMPRPDEVSYIFKHWRMIDDLMRRLKASKVEYLEGFKRDNIIKGEIYKKDYLIFTYTIKIKGTMASVRSFVNEMLDAYKDYKIYRIRNMELTSNDEAAKIIQDSSSGTTRKKSRRGRGRSRRGRSRKGSGNGDDALASDEAKAKLYVPVLGVDDPVEAVIKFDYIIYIGNEMKRGSRK